MKRLMLFGTPTWPTCPPMKEALSNKNIKFEYVDICESVYSLRKFLRIRDSYDDFSEIRKLHRVGIPAILLEGEILFPETPEHIEEIIQKYNLSE